MRVAYFNTSSSFAVSLNFFPLPSSAGVGRWGWAAVEGAFVLLGDVFLIASALKEGQKEVKQNINNKNLRG